MNAFADDEMMGSYDDFKITPKGKHKSYEVEYESLSQDAVEQLMSADVEHICGIFGVDVSHFQQYRCARVLNPLSEMQRCCSYDPCPGTRSA